MCRIGFSYPNPHLDWLGCNGVLTQGPVVFLVSVIVLVGNWEGAFHHTDILTVVSLCLVRFGCSFLFGPGL